MNFYIDPYIFTIDKETLTKSQLEEFIENIIDWKKLIDLNWGNVYRLKETFDILFKYNLFPLVDNLKEVIDKYNIDYIQPEEIDKILNSLLNKLPTVEDSFDLSDILIDEDNLSLESNRNDEFLDILKKLTVIIKINCLSRNERDDANIIISKEIKEEELKFNAIVSLVYPEKEIELPKSIDIAFNQYENYRLFCANIDPCIVWINSKGDLCQKIALYIKIYQLDKESEFFYLEIEPNFILHDNFYKTMKNLGFDIELPKINTLLRSISEEILNRNMQNTHDLRESKGGGSKQIKVNQYSAWRRDIDYDYHLHYWRNGNELIFTDVVKHNNFKITRL
ncbi:hypothetical protein [Myroides odoratus]|uniref:Uncharacterized protein n=1 Tax=Myroides odoratus TaxID=256 RepID=A0A378RQ67_MYROD|nr:hypothetical protein [Myroides odoratus]QQU04754.1 hypothetical protein I6I89_05545 [Myroides odoratus]STZ27800.1 Uncharacterised protein [Myroides odoratus]